MSVTSPTLIAGLDASVVVAPPPPADPSSSSSPPHAVAPIAKPMRPIARIDLHIPFLNTSPHLPVLVLTFWIATGRPVPRPNLQTRPELGPKCFVGEGCVDRVAGHLQQRILAESHLL